MADIIDRANERAHAILCESLQRHRRRQSPPAPSCTACQDCGEPIPAERQRAIVGCRYCVDCQTRIERSAAR